jgi:hypothetical protein
MQPPVDPRDAGPDPLQRASLRQVALVATLAALVPPLALFDPFALGVAVAGPLVVALAIRR